MVQSENRELREKLFNGYRLRATEGGTAWDAVYVTGDPSFVPEEMLPPAAPILLP